MDLNALAADRARYSKARRGLKERGATLGECAAVAAWASTVRLRVPGAPNPAGDGAGPTVSAA